MQRYGMLKEGGLLISDVRLEGYKLLEYAEVPAFDQSTQYVEEGKISEYEMSIFVEYEVRDLPVDDDPPEPKEETEFIELEPWRDVDQAETERQKEIEVLRAQNKALADRAEFVEELIFEMAMQVYQ